MTVLTKAETQRRERILREMYPTASTSEIKAQTGIPRSWLIRHAKRLGLTHTPDTEKRLHAKKYINRHIDRALLSRRHKARYKMERFRLLSGMPQETRIYVSLTPKKVRRAMYKLAREKNYWIGDIESRILYYDSHTHRTRCEAHHISKSRITFVEGERA